MAKALGDGDIDAVVIAMAVQVTADDDAHRCSSVRPCRMSQEMSAIF
jgi:hypothetical protein